MKITRLVLFLLFIALLIRVIIVTLYGQQNTSHGDATGYNAYAVAILENEDWITNPDFYGSSRPPFYPMLIAAVYAIFGVGNLFAVYVLQAFISMFVCLYIYKFSSRIFDRNTATLALLWSVPYVYYSQYVGTLMRETTIFFLLLAFFYYLYLYLTNGKPISVYFWLASIVYFLLIHTDPRYLFYLPFMITLFVIYQPCRLAIRDFLMFSSVVVLLMVPWTVRNYIAYGGFVLINTRTLDLRNAKEKNPRMDIFLKYNVLNFSDIEWTANKDYPTEKERVLIKQGANPNSRPLQEISAIRNDVYPARNFWERKWFQFKEFWRPCRFNSAYRPFPDCRFTYWSKKHNLVSILCYGLLLPFMVLGFVYLFSKRRKLAWFLIFPLGIQTLLHVLQWSRTRYRNPIDAFIIIIACFGGMQLYRVLKQKYGD